MENGLVISLRFGQGCTIGNLRIQPIEPIAGFKISEQESIEEFYLPVLSLSQSIPFNADSEWFVFKPSFTSRNCTLALVNSEWFAQSTEEDDFPPGVRMEFTDRVKTLEWAGVDYQWLGNGIDIQIGEEIHTILEGDEIEFAVDGFQIKMQLDNLKGRSGAQLRFFKPFNVKLHRDI